MHRVLKLSPTVLDFDAGGCCGGVLLARINDRPGTSASTCTVCCTGDHVLLVVDFHVPYAVPVGGLTAIWRSTEATITVKTVYKRLELLSCAIDVRS